MSAEAWRRTGTDGAPLHLTWLCVRLSAPRARFVWQAWILQDLHGMLVLSVHQAGDLRGRRVSVPQPGFVWQAWCFRCLHRCPRKLGDELALMGRRCILRGSSGSICVAGVNFRYGTVGTSGSMCWRSYLISVTVLFALQISGSVAGVL